MNISFRRARSVAVAAVGTLTASLLSVGLVAPAGASTPYTPWSGYLVGWTSEYIPTSENDCVAGRTNCVKQTLKELARIFDPAVQSCDHDAVFAHAYLRITQTYVWSRDIPGYYQDVPFANHQDAVFAKYYTDAYTNWHAGNVTAVPQSWRTAFEAARDKRVSATGDLLLGMNAHINRDLAFVLAAVGLVAPDGSSRKPDYDKVEEFLNEATEAMLAEAAARLDPTLDDADEEIGVGYWAVFQAISAWRENAWRNAEDLVSAPTAAHRAQVAARIEAQANAVADGLLLTHGHLPGQSSQARDAYCAIHHDDPAPMAYPFGTPAPYGYH
ncbi:DUF5995 family protein [Nocardioides sp.]|uniref:DUF5995 family protein n=1 Tax=Nocardioides sp. TaxID=35761 RepID=UPI00356B5FC9